MFTKRSRRMAFTRPMTGEVGRLLAIHGFNAKKDGTYAMRLMWGLASIQVAGASQNEVLMRYTPPVGNDKLFFLPEPLLRQLLNLVPTAEPVCKVMDALFRAERPLDAAGAIVEHKLRHLGM